MLSQVALEQERMLPVLQDLLRTNNDLELRSLTGFLRNLSRHARDKNDFCKYSTHSLPPPSFHDLFQTTSSYYLARPKLHTYCLKYLCE